MEVKESVEIPNWEAPWLVESKALIDELSQEGPLFSHDNFITLHHVNYYKYSKKLLFKWVKVKGKHVTVTWGSNIEIKNANHIDVMELHRDTGEAFVHTLDDQEKQNTCLKQIIVELEVDISPKSLFSQPLSIIQPIEDSLGNSWKFDKITKLLTGVQSFVVKNIKRRIDITHEAYEVL